MSMQNYISGPSVYNSIKMTINGTGLEDITYSIFSVSLEYLESGMLWKYLYFVKIISFCCIFPMKIVIIASCKPGNINLVVLPTGS